jgi:hypothetical protein
MMGSFTRRVVLEFSETFISAGIAGEWKPRFTLPHQHQHSDDELELRLHYCTIIRRILIDTLLLKTRQCHVLIIEPLFWPRKHRDSLFSSLLLDYRVSHSCF